MSFIRISKITNGQKNAISLAYSMLPKSEKPKYNINNIENLTFSEANDLIKSMNEKNDFSKNVKVDNQISKNNKKREKKLLDSFYINKDYIKGSCGENSIQIQISFKDKKYIFSLPKGAWVNKQGKRVGRLYYKNEIITYNKKQGAYSEFSKFKYCKSSWKRNIIIYNEINNTAEKKYIKLSEEKELLEFLLLQNQKFEEESSATLSNLIAIEYNIKMRKEKFVKFNQRIINEKLINEELLKLSLEFIYYVKPDEEASEALSFNEYIKNINQKKHWNTIGISIYDLEFDAPSPKNDDVIIFED